MPKRTSKKKDDENVIASSIINTFTGESITGKNPAAVALGRLGGLKGGKARAEKLSAKRRKEIAHRAATTRWAKYQDE